VVTPETVNLFGGWFITADPTNEYWSISLLAIVVDRIRLADQLEDDIRGLHEPVHQFVDIPAEVTQQDGSDFKLSE
jgi:hypothetical protein